MCTFNNRWWVALKREIRVEVLGLSYVITIEKSGIEGDLVRKSEDALVKAQWPTC